MSLNICNRVRGRNDCEAKEQDERFLVISTVEVDLSLTVSMIASMPCEN